MGGSRTPMDTHKRQRAERNVKKVERALPKDEMRFSEFSVALQKLLSTAHGAVRTQLAMAGISVTYRKVATGPDVPECTVTFKRRGLGKFPVPEMGMVMHDVAALLGGLNAHHFIGSYYDSIRPLLTMATGKMSMLELKKLGQDIKASAIEEAAKNQADAAHLIAQCTLVQSLKSEVKKLESDLKTAKALLEKSKEKDKADFRTFLEEGGPSKDRAEDERLPQLGDAKEGEGNEGGTYGEEDYQGQGSFKKDFEFGSLSGDEELAADDR